MSPQTSSLQLVPSPRGAGGGVVADSDPEGEWMESNAKARALTRVLGFEPEEAV